MTDASGLRNRVFDCLSFNPFGGAFKTLIQESSSCACSVSNVSDTAEMAAYRCMTGEVDAVEETCVCRSHGSLTTNDRLVDVMRSRWSDQIADMPASAGDLYCEVLNLTTTTEATMMKKKLA